MGTNKCRSHKVMCSNKKLKDQTEIEYTQLQLDVIYNSMLNNIENNIKSPLLFNDLRIYLS